MRKGLCQPQLRISLGLPLAFSKRVVTQSLTHGNVSFRAARGIVYRRRVAVVVGVSRQAGDFPDLAGIPVADAAAVAGVLATRFGFEDELSRSKKVLRHRTYVVSCPEQVGTLISRRPSPPCSTEITSAHPRV